MFVGRTGCSLRVPGFRALRPQGFKVAGIYRGVCHSKGYFLGGPYNKEEYFRVYKKVA